MIKREFWKDKRVFITGHTGFKGAWICQWLLNMGANVTGYALEPSEPSLYKMISLDRGMHSVIGDIRDLLALKTILLETQPEIIIHMAAQPIVRESYKNPVYTYETNVMGTVNLLESVRSCNSVKSIVNVTTDKVYENKEWFWGYRENENLCGYDPYSNSKSCSELVTYSYKNSFFHGENAAAISTARSGNVIGGGDFAVDRIIPDCIRAAQRSEMISVRNPYSIRPYQHVLDCLSGYLLLAEKQYENKAKYEGNYNFGPDDRDCITTGELADLFCDAWGNDQKWETQHEGSYHEANFLKLDCAKSKSVLGWAPKWGIKEAVEKTVECSKLYRYGESVLACVNSQIEQYSQARSMKVLKG